MRGEYVVSITELKLLNDKLEKELHELKVSGNKEIDLLVKTFRHTHSAHYEGEDLTETCGECGLSMRHQVHFREGEK